MSLMNSYATEATATDIVSYGDIDAIAASIVIEFSSPDECEAIVTVRDGVEHRYCRVQRDVELTVTSPRGGWLGFRCRATPVYFVRNGVCVGQTAVLPRISSQREADGLTNRGLVEVVRDTIKFF